MGRKFPDDAERKGIVIDCTSGSSSDSDSMTVIGGGPETTGTAAAAGEGTTEISGTALPKRFSKLERLTKNL